MLFADHNAYYSDLCYHVKGVSKDDYSNVEGNHLPCIIYNDELPAMVNSTFCSTYDLYPTVCDLLSLSYNSALAQGYSIYSDEIENTVFVSSLSGMYTDKMFTSNIEDVYVLDNSITEQDVQDFQNHIMQYYAKQEIIELIFQYNYFDSHEV